MGGKPSKGTPKDKRLKENKTTTSAPTPAARPTTPPTTPGTPLPKDW